MSHDHHHDHDHEHNHKHDHNGHGHTHEHGKSHDHHAPDNGPDNGEELSFDKKLAILIGHWIDHNKSHQGTYDSWADKAAKENQQDVALLLKEISKDSTLITQKLEKALQKVKN